LPISYSSATYHGAILYRESPTTNIGFGPVQTLILGTTLRDPTGTKATYHPDVAVLANNQPAGQAVGVLATDNTVPTVPAPPVLVSPLNSASDIPVNPILNWQGAEDADSYHLQVSSTADLSSTVSDSSAIVPTTFQVSGLQNSTVYYWRVRAVNLAGEGGWASIRNFTTEQPPLAVPQPPLLTSPADAAQDLPLNPMLAWEAAVDADDYQVQVAVNANFSPIIFDQSNVPVTSLQLSELQYSSVYYWRVRGNNASGDGDWSSVWSFTTEEEPLTVPTAPALDMPANAATGITINPTLQWNPSPGADSYSLQVSATPDFALTVSDQTDRKSV